MNAISFALQAFQVLPELISAGADVMAFIDAKTAALKKMQDENRDPTDAEWNELNQTVESLRSQRPKV